MSVVSRTWSRLPIQRLREPAFRLPVAEGLIGVVIFAIALAVYNAALTPSLSYRSFEGDEPATIPHQVGLAHMTGYPLYTLVGKLSTSYPWATWLTE